MTVFSHSCQCHCINTKTDKSFSVDRFYSRPQTGESRVCQPWQDTQVSRSTPTPPAHKPPVSTTFFLNIEASGGFSQLSAADTTGTTHACTRAWPPCTQARHQQHPPGVDAGEGGAVYTGVDASITWRSILSTSQSPISIPSRLSWC